MPARRPVFLALALASALALLALAAGTPAFADENEPLSHENADCLGCHIKETPGVVNQWKQSRHAQTGVGCFDCHGAKASEVDAYEHHDRVIATLVSPKDCGECHERAFEETARSKHATAGDISGASDFMLANAGAGHPVALAACEACHGVKVEIDPDSPNKLSAKSWPNAGIGRINPDGSLGACSACHTRHVFSNENARRPEACSQCHLGPDHPQKEAYASSKHGNAYYTNVERMNLGAEEWVVGIDYFAAPTCSSCHMGATRKQEMTHDVGERISWDLLGPVSARLDDWEKKRNAMQDTCMACHGETFTNNFYTQFDAVVRLYDEKFGTPARDIMQIIQRKKLLESPAAFGNELEWIYWQLWHQHGRAARHGAAKMSPEYTWWHGIQQVIETFYLRFIPAARALGDAEVDKKIEEVLADPRHGWVREGAVKGTSMSEPRKTATE